LGVYNGGVFVDIDAYMLCVDVRAQWGFESDVFVQYVFRRIQSIKITWYINDGFFFTKMDIRSHTTNAYERMLRARSYDDRMRLLALVASMRFMDPAPPPPVRRLPEFTLEEDVGTCGICMEEMESGEAVRWLPCQETINHAFHTECIDPWLKSHSSCPTCRGTW
tara:strand:+ start:976 stop:1470 length:495 start_codon:yes stop_codon:yes gene_type:complete